MQMEIPGRAPLTLEHAVFDLNGTLSLDGGLLPGVRKRAQALSGRLSCLLLTADTFGTGEAVARELGFDFHRVADGAEKVAVVRSLGTQSTVAVGNGQNDAGMLGEAALGIVVLGPEGTAVSALKAAGVVVSDIRVAFDLLLHPTRLVATLRV